MKQLILIGTLILRGADIAIAPTFLKATKDTNSGVCVGIFCSFKVHRMWDVFWGCHVHVAIIWDGAGSDFGEI